MANQRASESNQLEADLWQNLAIYMNCEIGYTLKRLLPADLKVCNDDSTRRISKLIFQTVFRLDTLRRPHLRLCRTFGTIQTESIRQ